MLLLEILLLLMILGAVIALEVRDLLSSVVAVGAVGLLLSVVFLLLQAPDVAITQLAVEIVLVILLIRATLGTSTSDEPGRLRGAVVTVILLGGTVFLAGSELVSLPPFGAPLMRVSETYLSNGLLDTGAANLVTSVILDYRAYDTLGEATILFAAVVGVAAVLRQRGKQLDRDTRSVRNGTSG